MPVFINGGLDFMEKKLSCNPERRLSVLWRVSVECYFVSYSRPILMDYPTITEALITPLIKLTSVFLQMSSSNSQCICMWMNQDQGSVSGTFRVYNLEFEHLPQKIFTLKTISVKIYVGDDFIIYCCTLWNLKLWGDKLRQLFCCFLFCFCFCFFI